MHTPKHDPSPTRGDVPTRVEGETIDAAEAGDLDQTSPLDREHLDLGNRSIDVGSGSADAE